MIGMVKDKVALVTGASGGIGRAACLLFAKEGAKVVVVDIDPEGALETVRMVKETGGDAHFFKADVSNAVDVEHMVTETISTYQRLDCAFNNAGISSSGPAARSTIGCTEEEYERMMDINLKGVWLCMKYEIQQMLTTGGGAIVNTSSFAGLRASKIGEVVYSGSKHGVIGLSKSAAVEYAKQGIRINVVCPGATMTPMLEKHIHTPEDEAEIAALNPMNRICSPSEIAEAAVWLCSDRASFVTGVSLPVDGGQVL
jgi:NAD(P)-dependent dehydrogenase (short-subunit alcohol dehydrogenase family)